MFIMIVMVIILVMTYEKWTMGRIPKTYPRLTKYIYLPLIGHAYKIFCSPEARMTSLKEIGDEANENGGVIGVWFGRKFYTVISEAVIAEAVLKSCHEKAEFLYILRDLLGNGSIFAPVHIWRPRRKVILSTLTQKNLRGFLPIFVRRSNILVDRLQAMVGNGSFAIDNYLTLYMLESVCETMLGEDSKKDCKHFIHAFNEYCKLATARMSNPVWHVDAIYKLHPSCKEYQGHIKTLQNFVNEIIQSKKAAAGQNIEVRKRNGADGDQEQFRSFLEIFIDQSEESGLTVDELREEILVLALAGTDTSSVSTAFVCSVLSRYNDIQDRLYNEIFSVYGNSNRYIAIEDLSKFKYLEAVIKETLRLYPPVPVIARKMDKDVEIRPGLTLAKDTGVLFNIWSMHRNSRFWGKDAADFNPDRFLKQSKYYSTSYMPFSLGPRNCLGYQYAMFSIKTALISLLRNYRLLPPSDVTNKPLSVTFDVMLRDLDKARVRLESRF